MPNFVDNILADVCLDERISGGIFKLDEEEHIQALRDHLVKKGLTQEDAVAYTNKVLEGRFPERQAYNADGVLVTFPTPQHKKKAIQRGTHFEENPAPQNTTPPTKPEKRTDIPPPANNPPAEAKPEAEPAPEQPAPAAQGAPQAQTGPTTSVVQGDKQLAVEPPRGDQEAEPIPQPPAPAVPTAPKTPMRTAAEKAVVQQILATDDTALSPIVPANEGKEVKEKEVTQDVKHCARCGKDHKDVKFKKFTKENAQYSHWALCPTNGEPILMKIEDTLDEILAHQLNELCKKSRVWGFQDAETFIKKFL